MNRKRNLRDWIVPKIDAETILAMMKNNIIHARRVSLLVSILEMVILATFVSSSEDPVGAEHLHSVLQVGFCALLSLIVFGFLNDIVHRENFGSQRRVQFGNLLIFSYFVLLSIWGMYVSWTHYIVGEQILTYFIVQIMFLCFVTLPPLLALPAVVGNFLIFYAVLYQFDGAANLNIFNYVGMAFLCWIGAAGRFHMEANNVQQLNAIRRLNSELDIESRTDGLTRLGNRIALRHYIPRIVGQEVHVMMADLDKFKNFNDVHGHDMGDQVLVRVSELLSDTFPPDCCFRFGGDEFLVLLPAAELSEPAPCADAASESEPAAENKTSRAFLAQAECWAEAVSRVRIEGLDIPIRATYGVVSGHPQTEEDMRALMHLADQRLYKNKH